MNVDPAAAVAIYIRLSRDDLNAPGSLDEKFANRTEIARELARKHNLIVPDNNILCERASGTKLDARPKLQSLLQQARAGTLRVLITPYQDRLTRGDDHDRGTIKEALIAGNVTLITTEGIITFDRQFGDRDELMFDIKSAVAAHYVRDIIKKRKEADLIRLREGKASRSIAPYGYHRVSRRDVLTGIHPADQLGTYHTVSAEYAVVEEIFARLASGDTVAAVVTDLNHRQVPPPGTRTNGASNRRWYEQSVYHLLRNPFYVGYLSQRWRVERGRGTVRLSPADHILSTVKGAWPQPVDEETWQRLTARLGRQVGTVERRTGLFTGLIYCPRGVPMRVESTRVYGCPCALDGNPHKGAMLMESRLVRWIVAVIRELNAHLPEMEVTINVTKRSPTLARDLAAARQALKERGSRAQDLMLREEYFVGLLGREMFESAARRARQEWEESQALVERLDKEARQPDVPEVLRLFQTIRNELGAAEDWFPHADSKLQMQVISSVVQRIDVVEPGGRFVRDARLTVHDWAVAYAPNLPPLPALQVGKKGKG